VAVLTYLLGQFIVNTASFYQKLAVV